MKDIYFTVDFLLFVRKKNSTLSPTGYGKSVILEVIPYLEADEIHTVVGITHLSVILIDHQKKYGDHVAPGLLLQSGL